jgi:hypothetical protein
MCRTPDMKCWVYNSGRCACIDRVTGLYEEGAVE